ncbi:hypothetical protein GCM10022384_00950 [Streptomyces marokkonensis]|uniref:Uncharacterized protein n=1 Tax=Streptomyces marokkonensis TaxID=324855 RepID=A0ABP7NNI5_9ACTN
MVIITSFPTDHSFGISVTRFPVPGKTRTHTEPRTLDTATVRLDYWGSPHADRMIGREDRVVGPRGGKGVAGR